MSDDENEISSESMDENLKKIVYEKAQGSQDRPIDNPEKQKKKNSKQKNNRVRFNLVELGLLLGIKKEPRKFNPRYPPLD
jgi:hypothetical protein